MNINDLCIKCHSIARDKGFWDEKRNEGEIIALIHSELSEALEGLRKGNPMSSKIPRYTILEEELADTIIRICDLAGAKKLRLEEAISAKIKYNTRRKRKHGKEF